MSWNQPGGNNNPWGKKRPGQDGGNVDEAFRNFQRKLEGLLRGGQGQGDGPGSGGDAAGGNNRSTFILVAGIAVAAWLFMSFFQIGAAERGVVQRFGKLVDVRNPGLGFVFWPIERVTVVNVAQVNSVEYKARVLTKDINLVDMALNVQYQLRDPVKYLFSVRQPEQTLREVSESAIREVVGRNNLEAIFVSNRQQITELTKELIQRTLDSYQAGMIVTTVNLTDIQVPEAVVPSQRDANKALADKDRFVKEAEAYSSGVLPVAEGTASRQIQEAEGYKAQVVAIAEGEASRFTELATAYKNAPRVTRERLYIEAVEGVLSRSRKVIIDTKEGSNNMMYLPLDKLMERGGARTDSDAAAARAATTTEPESSATTDARTRGER